MRHKSQKQTKKKTVETKTDSLKTELSLFRWCLVPAAVRIILRAKAETTDALWVARFLLLLFRSCVVCFSEAHRVTREVFFVLSIDSPLLGSDEMCWKTSKIHFHRPTVPMNLWWHSLKLPRKAHPNSSDYKSFPACHTALMAECNKYD